MGAPAPRVADDPVALAHLRDLEAALRDAVNAGAFRANRGRQHYSLAEIAAVLGISRAAVSKRVHLGEQATAEAVAASGGGTFSRIGEVRARRAEVLKAAGVPDRTGSARELKAAAG